MEQYLSKEWRDLDENKKKIIQRLSNNPEVPLGNIAQELDLKVYTYTFSSLSTSGAIKLNKKTRKYEILISRHENRRRQRFTLAHEIAHFLLHKELIGDGLSDDILYRSKLPDQKEFEANRLAADLIMPMHLILAYMKDKDPHSQETIRALADIFQVSDMAMSIRIEHLLRQGAI